MKLDVGCGRFKRGDIGVDYMKGGDADVIADAHHLPFRNETFETVYSYTVLEHSPNPLNFLKEQHRVLVDGGNIICVTDNAQFYAWSVLRIGSYKHEEIDSDHHMIFFPKNVCRLMKLAGFSNITSEFITLPETHLLIPLLMTLFVKMAFFRKEALFKRFKVKGVKYG